MNQFGEPIQPAMDNTKIRPVTRLLMNLKCNDKWKNSRASRWSRIDQILIHEQLGISNEGAIDDVSATFEEAKSTLKRIVGPHVFVENEQWNVVHM
jgi:hypothetical protein